MSSDIRILYVEDDVSISVFTSEILSKKTGANIITANNGEKGLELFRSNTPDIIITDICMPVMDGIEMIQQIRRVDQTVSIIVTTAFRDVENILKCIEYGIDAFIIKPVNIDKICKKVFALSEQLLLKRKIDEQNKLIEKLSLAVRHSPVAIGITDSDGNVEYVNTKYLELTGYDNDAVIGKHLSDCMFKEGGKSFYNEMWQSVSMGNDWSGQVDQTDFKGDVCVSRIHVTPLLDDDGCMQNLICVKEDVTNLHNLQKQLMQSHRMEAVGQLAGGVAHEFNNILTAIISYSSVIGMKLEDDVLKGYSKKVIASAEKAAEMTKSLLAFSRKDIIQPEPYSLGVILKNISQMLVKIVGGDIKLIIDNEDAEVMALVDYSSIEQVVYHLINNSREAMPDGGEIHIAIGVEKPIDCIAELNEDIAGNDFATIEIRDTGCGMSQDVFAKAFDPFFTTKEVGDGPGLGLSIIYGIIKQHHGYVHMESEVGVGTTVRIFVPLK